MYLAVAVVFFLPVVLWELKDEIIMQDAIIPIVLYPLVTAAVMRTTTLNRILNNFVAIGHDNIQTFRERQKSGKLLNILMLLTWEGFFPGIVF